jgi:hypothetical protein
MGCFCNGGLGEVLWHYSKKAWMIGLFDENVDWRIYDSEGLLHIDTGIDVRDWMLNCLSPE